ncbi:hypothetical protein HRbin23_00023 [bacterium HR23]|nr:hypothetical protein HRbin23_00023 [bacterium HR23]
MESPIPPALPQGRRWPPLLALVLWLGVILGVSSWPRPALPVEPPSFLRQALAPTVHFLLYGVLGLLASWALKRGGPQRIPPLLTVAGVGLFGFLWGMLDEWYQGFIPGRDSSWGDVAVDVVGAIAGGVAFAWLVARGGRGHLSPQRSAQEQEHHHRRG